MSGSAGQRTGLPWTGQGGFPHCFVVLFDTASYSLAAQEVKMKGLSRFFYFFFLKYSFNVSISGTGTLGVLINCS